MNNRDHDTCDEAHAKGLTGGPRRPTDTDTKVGDRVRLRRTMLGMRQSDLARRCNVSPQQIHKYEIGASRLTTSRLVQMSDALEVPVGWFFDEPEKDGPFTDELINILRDHANLEALMTMHNITHPGLKLKVLKVLKLLAGGDTSIDEAAQETRRTA